MAYSPRVPISYGVELTFACHHTCPGCANILEGNRHEVLKNWQTLFDAIAPPHYRRQYAELFRITGGEPTLHPEFCQIIKYIDTFGIPHAVFTNGRWEDSEVIINTFRHCENFVGLLVSLHGAEASAHYAFIGTEDGAFEESCANIQRAANAKLEVFTNTVLTRHNCDQIEAIIALSQKLGASHAVFNRYLGKPLFSIEPSEEQLRNAIRLIEQLQNNGVPCHIGDCIPSCFESNSSLGSNSGIEHCVISPYGDVRPENLTRYTFGNIFEQSIEEIWQSDKAQWYREQIPEQCLECIELSHCRGGCRSLMVEYNLPGDPLMREPIQESQIEPIELDPHWRILPYFTVRSESFGYLLCRVNWSIPVTHDAKPLVEIIQQKPTIVQLHQQFGDEALELIGHLYREGLVGFEE